MKVKMADVARYLGISKATVSLAVNNKPGVNEQTRQKILRCIGEMEQNDGILPKEAPPEPMRAFRIIKVVIINHRKQVVCDPELDLWSEVLSTFDAEARKRGYLYGLTYLNETDGNQQEIIEECNLDMVAGVILFGTEAGTADHEVIRRIHKPMVIYDYEMPDGSYSSVCIDNARAVETGLEQIKNSGVQDIRYFSTGKEVYNFQKRREAFQDILLKWGRYPKKEDIVRLGNSIGEITGQAVEYFRTHKAPEAALMENYQVSIGVLTAVRKLGIKVPGELKLVGIDEVPEYIVPDFKLSHVKIPHVERAAVAMSLLDREIRGDWDTKIRVFAVPEFIPGKSV